MYRSTYSAEDIEFPPGWYEAMGVVYVPDVNLEIGANNSIHSLGARDIFLVNGSEVRTSIEQFDH